MDLLIFVFHCLILCSAMATELQSDPKSPEVMSAFYNRLYPFKTLFTWLSHTPVPISSKDAVSPKSGTTWTHREFAFTLQSDAYLRYNSFQDVDELKKQILKLIPSRFEIGAVYNARVSISISKSVFDTRNAA